MRFVDTNILVYAVSAQAEDLHKRLRARELLAGPDLAVSVQVLQEFYHQATRPSRNPRIGRDRALMLIEAIGHLPVQDVTVELFRSAVDLSRRFQLSYWDSAILAAARSLGCDAIYSEDLSAGQDYDGLRVINPFAAGAGAS